MPLDPNDPQVRVAIFGEQVKQFLDSDIGVYLLQCADEDAGAAMREFAQVELTDTAKLAAIQLKLNTARNVENWLKQAIIAGKQAFDTEDL